MLGWDAEVSNAIALILESGDHVLEEFFCFLDIGVIGSPEFPGDGTAVGWVDRVFNYVPGILFIFVVDTA